MPTKRRGGLIELKVGFNKSVQIVHGPERASILLVNKGQDFQEDKGKGNPNLRLRLLLPETYVREEVASGHGPCDSADA
jgi:hypothetical protein